MSEQRRIVAAVVILLAVLITLTLSADAADEQKDKPLVMIVMDPLAKELSCPCVAGYAQRDYGYLADQLGKAIGRRIEVTFSESLAGALKDKTEGRADLIIGKHSVVLHDAKAANLKASVLASLTDKEGSTTQSGMIVVTKDDAAQKVADLQGYRILFGPEESDEKHASALALLAKSGIERPAKLETVPGCSDGCTIILELPDGELGAAVISSYAKPLLEGCGTVEKGALRVVGQTEPVPFIEVFATEQLASDIAEQVSAALRKANNDPLLLIKLETKRGFVPLSQAPPVTTASLGENAKKK